MLHFEAVGHLIGGIRWDRASEAAKILYRIATESYIYHVAILAMFYTQTDRYASLSPNVKKLLEHASGPKVNMIISLDVSIYIILFELTVLSRADQAHTDYAARLDAVQVNLSETLDRVRANSYTTPTTVYEDEFWKLTHVAGLVLQIFLTKVKNPSILATAEDIKNNVSVATKVLNSVASTRAWTGNFVWMVTILLCAASTPDDVKKVDDKVNEIKQGLWGGDLLRIQQVIRVVQQKRRQLDRVFVFNDNVIIPEDYDTLSILLNKNGILGWRPTGE